MEYEKDPDKIYVTANRNKVSTAGRYQQLASSQEEAGTKMILYAVDVRATNIGIHSADTDVFILCQCSLTKGYTL